MHMMGMSLQLGIMGRVIPTPDHRAVGRLPMERVMSFVPVEKLPGMQRGAIGLGDHDPVVVTAVPLAVLDDIEPPDSPQAKEKSPWRIPAISLSTARRDALSP
jgi:hypothetical protein